MKLLIVTDIDNPGLEEDCLIAKSFIKDGHQVTIARQDYDENLDDLYDAIIIRNIWHLDNSNYESLKQQMLSFKERLKRKNIPCINLISKYDDSGKLYLKELFNMGYSVIPTFTDIKDMSDYNSNDEFLLKPLDGYDGYGIKTMKKKDIKDTNNYILQPKIKFEKEIEFYFLKNKFQFCLEFVPSKKPIYPVPSLYKYTEEELKIAKQFADLCEDEFFGVQRIDFLKSTDGKLLLLEIGDSAPYLNLIYLDKSDRTKFINEYKEMVYEYINKFKSK